MKNKYCPEILIIIFCFIWAWFGCQYLFNEYYTDTNNSSTQAQIINVGFSNEIPNNGEIPTEIDIGNISDEIISYCQIDNLDVASNVTVTWTKPNGETDSSNMSINRNGYYYSATTFDNQGTYEVSWQIQGQKEIKKQLTVK